VKIKTYVGEEDPLHHLGVVVRVRDRVEGELLLLVVVLGEVEDDRRGLEDLEVAAVRVNNSRTVMLRMSTTMSRRDLLDQDAHAAVRVLHARSHTR
jgi:hypothetical protein